MGSGTAGAVLDAIARMRRAERELSRRPRIGHVRALPRRDGGAPDRLPFPCFFLCDGCGRLEEGTSNDPMRREGDDDRAPGPCPACHATAWVDLRRQSTALAYREAETMDVRRRAESGDHRSLWLGAATTTAVTTALVLWQPVLIEIPAVVMLVFIATWLAASRGVAALARRARPTGAQRPRWRRPVVGSGGSERASVRGTAKGDASLRAPLSQAPCLGWSLQVWSDDVQLLDEQHHVAFAIDGETFEPDSVRLELETRELVVRPDDQAFARFLQRRGLSPHDPSLRVREAYLVPGAVVEVQPRDPVKGGLVLGPSMHALAA